MPYTLWSRGRLLGESDLGFVQILENVKFGWFHPSPYGEQMMPILTGAAPLSRKLGKMLRNPLRQAMRPREPKPGWPDDIRRSTTYADYRSVLQELEAMQLELRDPEGRVMATSDIHIDDGEYKMSLVPKKLRGDCGDSSMPRYQIQVELDGVPRRWLHSR